MKPKVIGVIGTRRRDSGKDFNLVREAFLRVYQPGDAICSGLCPKGGDKFALIFANTLEIPTLWFPANWKRYGRSAGFRRNSDIAYNSDVLIACVAADRTGGTEDTIKKWKRAHPNKSVIIV